MKKVKQDNKLLEEIVTKLKNDTKWFGPMIDSFKKVYYELGHGHREKTYQNFLCKELTLRKIENKKEYTVTYDAKESVKDKSFNLERTCGSLNLPLDRSSVEDEKIIGQRSNDDEKVGQSNGRIDILLTESKVTIEIKAIVGEPRPEDIRQLQNYLNSPSIDSNIGFCVNFPRKYQEGITVVALIRKAWLSSKTVKDVEEEKDDEDDNNNCWLMFTMRLKVSPHKKHLLTDLGFCTI